jgi:hypothetical protein
MTETFENDHYFGYLYIGDWDLFGVWDLVIGI